jgi:RNA polymerase sigma-70 factor (ECF subfamily)
MDVNQFKNLVLPLSDRLFRFASLMLRNSHEAEDAVQEVCIKLWRMRDSLGHLDSPEAFAMKTMRNWCLDKIKARRPIYLQSLNDYNNQKNDSPDPYIQTETNDLMQLLRKIMEQLPFQQKMVIQLRDMEGMDFKEIAGIMGMKINAIRVALSRGRNRIREMLIHYETRVLIQ